MKGYIYKLTCTITGKVYIGKTIDINRRMAQHSKITSEYSHHLANAFSKYVPVLQYDLNNNLLNRFNSITDAAKNIDKDTSHIVSCCKGRRKTAYGFIWKYEEKEVIHG